MRCVVGQRQLQRVLRVVERIVPKKGGSPAHYAVYLRVSGHEEGTTSGNLLIRATNGDVVYATTLFVEGAKAGDIAVPAAQFQAALDAAPERDVEITRTNGVTRVRSGRAEWTIPDLTGIAPDLAPQAWPDVEPRAVQQVEASWLRSVIERIQYAAARTSSRPSLMQLHFGAGRAVAADGRRLHQIEVPGIEHEFNVPVSLLDVITDAMAADEPEFISGQEGSVTPMTISLFDGFVGYEWAHTALIAGQLAYEFPDIDELVLRSARRQRQKVAVTGEELAAAIRAAKVADDRVELWLNGQTLTVQATSSRAQGRMELALAEGTARGGWVVDGASLLEALGRVIPYYATTPDFTVPDEGLPGFLFWDTGSAQVALSVEAVDRA